ncbi:5-dehydro-2-deoxygluconokinase [Shewanella surugensis]|uniref:5-dehydro-2-deoxygluconokinase n=1 Tax=Shewanella surugensis TaxID=212020 RepID=A0ABT0LIW5_9GAMM|nr:5-dehydro-2-deoxygluconokinase [Shewanella surugensis]MCL1127315.1 5-dehydro-2-deoxygluconokinase [Shewanella surugensis]
MQGISAFEVDQQRPIDIICMGRVAVDLYSEQVNNPLHDSTSFNKYLGGCAGNIAVGTARQGLKSAMFSCVGQDEMGMFLRKTLTKEGVDTTLLYDTPDNLTGLVLLGVCPPDHFPLLFYRENCADMQIKPAHCQKDFIGKAKSLLITGTGLSTADMRESTYHAIKIAKECGTKIIVDLDYRPVLWNVTSVGDGETRYKADQIVSNEYIKILADCDLIIGTEEEVAIASGRGEISASLAFIHSLTSAPIVLKTGEKGCEIYLKDKVMPIASKPFRVKVFNVLGAGDAFMSGLLGSLLKGDDWDKATTLANVCGAIVVTRHGCAPAIPNYAEAKYFVKHYHPDNVNDLLYGEELTRLHNLSTIGYPKDRPLTLLAYDHRWQFEKSCEKYNQPIAKITEFKQAVFDGFKHVYQSNSQPELGIIIDPQYGENILREAAFMGVNMCAPVEASGTEKFEWVDGISAYSSLINKSTEINVKVLWKYHTNLPEADKTEQIKRLSELFSACQKLDRRLMLELIIADGFEVNGLSLSNAMADVYKASIYPFWWKIQTLDTASQWQQVDQVISQYDDQARVIILGGAAKTLNHYQDIFKIAKSSQYVNGFALGRSIFWPSWEQFVQDEIKAADVAIAIADNYAQVLKMWREL